MAVIFPSCRAPMRMRWIVAGRWVVLLNISGRVQRHLHRTSDGAGAQRRQHGVSAQKQFAAEAAPDERGNEPHIFLWNARASSRDRRSPRLISWLDVQTVSRSPFHTADRSVRLHHRVRVIRRGVGYIEPHRRGREGRRRNRRPRSPASARFGYGGRILCAEARSKEPSARSYATLTSAAAARACSKESATTRATA